MKTICKILVAGICSPPHSSPLLSLSLLPCALSALKLCRNKSTRKCIVPRTSILDPQGVYVLKIPEGPVPVSVPAPVTVTVTDREKGELAAGQDAGPVEGQDQHQLQLPATEPLTLQREAGTGAGMEVTPPVLYLWIGESHSPVLFLTLLTVLLPRLCSFEWHDVESREMV